VRPVDIAKGGERDTVFVIIFDEGAGDHGLWDADRGDDFAKLTAQWPVNEPARALAMHKASVRARDMA